MGDAFLRALASDLEQTQRALRSNCLFCVPQPRSLVADEAISQETLDTHFLTPVGFGDADDGADVTTGDSALGGSRRAQDGRPGEYDTLNGKQVSIAGSHIHTGKGFDDRRKVRILLSEKREVHHQEVTVLHISRPLVGGLALPEDPSELDVATLRKYTAILRSFPENELCFYQLDETVSQVHKICQQRQFFHRYEQTLPAILREEWEAAVDELIHAGSFDDAEEDRQRHQRHGGGVDHLLQIQQVVECYLMEQLHDWVFPRVVAMCEEQDRKLRQVLYRMRHYNPEDFGIRKEFQCFALEARDVLLGVTSKKTPLDMLLVFKACIDRVSEAITRNIKLRRLDFDLYQLTTDDILDQLLFVLVQVFNFVALGGQSVPAGQAHSSGDDQQASTPFPIAAVLKYISDYHFINSNTTELGFTIANFQVAIEYFLMRGDHDADCTECADLELQGEPGGRCSQVIQESKCVQAAHRIRRDLMKAVENLELTRRSPDNLAGQEAAPPRPSDLDGFSGDDDAATMKHLSIVGEWYASEEAIEEDKEAVDAAASSLAVHSVEFIVDGKPSRVSRSKLTQVSGGQRFFAAVDEDGELFTWGDSSGGRLGYAIPDGDPRRVSRPQRVAALEQERVLHVACGAFHTLATDVNGHVFAWGSNSRGQLGFLAPGVASVEAPTVIADLQGTYVGAVACGEYHSLGLSSAGRVFSWGCNKYGQLGRASDSFLDAVQPRPLDADWRGWALDMKATLGGKDEAVVRRVAAGKAHSLAISSDGVGFTWGRGDSGQLGHGCYMDVSRPKQVMALTSAISRTSALVGVAGGSALSLFLLENGTAYISGLDPSVDSDALQLSPTLVTLPLALERDLFGQIAAVSCGEAHFALLSRTGALWHSFPSFSTPSKADAGTGTAELQQRRVQCVTRAGAVRRVVCGASHTLVIG